MNIAVVGVGPWGLCVLERLVASARQATRSAMIHLVEPGDPGVGVYKPDLPDYLILNNACGQLSLYTSNDDTRTPPYAVGFYDWVIRRGYRWVGHNCEVTSAGRVISPGDYLPRRLMGEYLAWFYQTLVNDLPEHVEVAHHRTRAIDVTAGTRAERLALEDGQLLEVDHVILTTGHTANHLGPEASPGFVPAYPVSAMSSSARPGQRVGLEGMGLVAYDVLAALTLGRGGSFEKMGERKRYRRSGREPLVQVYSRSGLPYCAKSASGTDPTGSYAPMICTPEALTALVERSGAIGGGAGVELRCGLLPLVLAEMKARFHYQSAFIAGGSRAAEDVRRVLTRAWQDGRCDQAMSQMEPSHGRFNPQEHIFAWKGKTFSSGKDFSEEFYDMVETDLDHALTPRVSSPVKAAEEVWRILRDSLRTVLEYQGLSATSYVDFHTNVRSRINRLEAGPPVARSQELLALLDAGIVEVSLGPSPRLTRSADGTFLAESTMLDRTHAEKLDTVVRGHLDHPSLVRSASPLLRALRHSGRLQPLRYGDMEVGSVAVSKLFHPLDSASREQERLWILGVLTEGARYFTHYLPSPQSRMRAVLDAEACAKSIMG